MENNGTLAITRSTVIALIIGVVIPLLGILVPIGVDYVKNFDNFIYSRSKPIFFKDKAAYSLEIKNGGNVIEKNVEVWINRGKDVDIEIEYAPNFNRPVTPLKIRDEEGFRVVSLGDMRSGEKVVLSIWNNWAYRQLSFEGYFAYPGLDERVVSLDRIAKHEVKKTSKLGEASVALSLTLSSIVVALSLLTLAIIRRKSQPSKKIQI